MSNSNQNNATNNAVKMHAVAMDGVCIVGPTECRHSTELYVKFYRTTGVAGTFMTVDRKRMESDTRIEMTCNGIACNNKVITFLGNDRLVKLDMIYNNDDNDDGNTDSNNNNYSDTYPSTIPSSAILSALPLQYGGNKLLFKHMETGSEIECILWMWTYKDKIMVVDIDGTITRSDVRGYIETVFMSYYQYCHKGVIEFFYTLEQVLHVKILFLTSRPIAHLQETRNLLNSLRAGNNNKNQH